MGGFELNNNTSGMECTAVNSTPTIQSTTVRSGVYALQITSLASGTAKGMRQNFLTTAGNGPYYFLIYFRYATAPSGDNQIIQLNNTNDLLTPIVMIKFNSAGALELWDEDGQIGSDSSALTANTWYRVEILFDRTAAAGSQVVRAYLDGTEFAGSATRDLSAGILTYNYGGNLLLETQTTGNWYFDDWAINDNTGSNQNGLIGEEEMILLSPDGAGSSTQWTRGGTDSGANWSQVEEIPPTDATDYVQSNTSGQIDYYTLSATPSALGSTDIIKCVAVGVRFAVDNATGADPDIRVNLKDNAGNTDNGTDIDVNSTSYRTNHNGGVLINYSLVSYTRAGGAGAWTKSELDSAQVGIEERVTDTHFARVAAVWVYVGHKPGAILQSVDGGITPSGAILKQGNKTLSGGNTPSGAVNKETAKPLSGGITPSGGILKETLKILSGALSSIVGTLQTALIYSKILSGSITPSGTNSAQTNKTLSGDLTSSGTLTKDSTKSFSGDLAPTGSSSKETTKAFSGTVTSSGDAVKQAGKLLAGDLASSGTISKQPDKVVSGTLTSSGEVLKQASKLLSGTLSSAGSLAKETLKLLSGALTSAGDLATQLIQGGQTYFKEITGALTPSGLIEKLTSKFYSGELTSSGDVNKTTQKPLSGATTPSGELTTLKAFVKVLEGLLTSSGELSKTIEKTLAGAITPSGSISKFIAKFVSGELLLAGSLEAAKTFIKSLDGGITFAGSISKAISKNLTGQLLPAGILNKGIQKALSGVLSFIGTLVGIIAGTIVPAPRIYLKGSLKRSIALSGEIIYTVNLSGSKDTRVQLQGSKIPL